MYNAPMENIQKNKGHVFVERFQMLKLYRMFFSYLSIAVIVNLLSSRVCMTYLPRDVKKPTTTNQS